MRRIIFLLVISISLVSCVKRTTYLADTNSSLYRIDKKLQETKPEIDAIIAPYKVKLDAEMNEVIAYNEAELEKGKPNSTLTNWFADTFLQGAKNATGKELDFAVQNYGGIRLNSVGKGDITIGRMYELMPFDNMLSILATDSSGVQKLCDRIANYGGWPVSSGLTFEIMDSIAVHIAINGESLSADKNYLIALPDYIANGGDNCFFLKEYDVSTTEFFIRDLLISAVKQQGKIKPNFELRIKSKENGQ